MSGPLRTVEFSPRGARVAFVLFAVVHIAIAAYGSPGYHDEWIAFGALALVLGAGFAVIGGPRGRLGRRRATVVALLCVVASVSVWNLPARGWPGWSSWIWGAVTFVGFFLALRGRTGVAWCTFLGMTVLTVWWAADVGRGPIAGVGFVIRSAALLFVVSLFALLLHRTGDSITRVQFIALDRARLQSSASASIDEQKARLAVLRQHSVPALLRIRSAEPLTDEDRQTFALLEGALRDQIRAGRLASPAVADAVRRARERGATVSLLNDRGSDDLTEDGWVDVEDAAVAALDAATGGSVTIRLLPDGRDVLATIVSDRDGEVTRTAVPLRIP